MKSLIPKIVFLTTMLFIFSCKSSNITAKIEDDLNLVPNKETAIKIAEAIWLPIYGKSIYEKKPYSVELIDNKIWRVKGTLKLEEVGGVPIIEIQKSDCKIINVTHSK